MSRKELLTAAMLCNLTCIADLQKLKEERQKQREAYQKEHGTVDETKLGVGCSKANCYQVKP